MTHAEQYSTSEPSAPPASRKLPRKRVFTVLALATSIGATSAVISTARPAAADQLSDAKAEAASVTAKLQAIQSQEQSLTGQVQSADYQLSQLQAQIAANEAQVAKDQVEVDKDQAQLRTQAITDYTSSGTSNQVTQMFSSDPNTTGIRSEYSSIATGNVTTTIDNLHTAQTQLQATQGALRQQQSTETNTLNSLQQSKAQAAQSGRPVPADAERCGRPDPDDRAATAGRRGRRRGRRRQGRLQRQVGHGPEGPGHRPDRGPDHHPQDGGLGWPANGHPGVDGSSAPGPGRGGRGHRRRRRASSTSPTSGVARPPGSASTAPVWSSGPSRRPASRSPVPRGPSMRPPPTSPWPTCNPVTCSSTVPGDPSTWPCTSGADR